MWTRIISLCLYIICTVVIFGSYLEAAFTPSTGAPCEPGVATVVKGTCMICKGCDKKHNDGLNCTKGKSFITPVLIVIPYISGLYCKTDGMTYYLFDWDRNIMLYVWPIWCWVTAPNVHNCSHHMKDVDERREERRWTQHSHNGSQQSLPLIRPEGFGTFTFTCTSGYSLLSKAQLLSIRSC